MIYNLIFHLFILNLNKIIIIYDIIELFVNVLYKIFFLAAINILYAIYLFIKKFFICV
jgi:hypothetical protein